MATLSKGLAKLRTQMNERYPKRDTSSDGWIGDKAHAARTSDHNPDKKGIVHALDLDVDFGNPKTKPAQTLVDELVAYAKSGKKGSARLKYVIYNRTIWSKANKWKPKAYTGTNPHTKHIHISATTASDADGTAWPLACLKKSA